MDPCTILCLMLILYIETQAQSFTRGSQEMNYKVSGHQLDFPCESTKNIYKSSGNYIPKNIIATRIQIHDDQVYVALPRFKPGIPFTLTTFALKPEGGKVTLAPYPCWAMQEEGNCDALQNVVDVVIDELDHLWCLDTGVVNTLEQPIRRCPPKIVGIDLKTGLTVKTICLEPFTTHESILQYMVIDYSPEGYPFAYISDGGAGAIIVVNLELGIGERLILPISTLPTAGGAHQDVLFIELVRKQHGNILYFTYLSSRRLFCIKVNCLQQEIDPNAIVDVGVKPKGQQIVLLGTDNGECIFFRFKGESDIFFWDSETSFNMENFHLVEKGDDYRLATEVVAGYGKLMWVIESNFYDYIHNTAGCLGPSIHIHPFIKACG